MRFIFIKTLLLGLLLILIGCQPSVSSNANEASKTAVNFTDAEGKTVAIKDNSRIVAIGTTIIETVYALGAGERLVGVDNSSHEYMPESKNLPTVGARNALNADKILLLKDGKISASGVLEKVFTTEIIAETFNVNVSVIKHPNFQCPLIVWQNDGE